MEAVAVNPFQTLRQDFQRFVQGRREPEQLTGLRHGALERFETSGIPTTRAEAWRFTDVSALGRVSFKRAGDCPVDADRLPELATEEAHRLVFVNGRFAPGLSQPGTLLAKAVITSLGQAIASQPERVLEHMVRARGLDEHPFAALNTAFMEDGAFVYLPRGASLTKPLHCVFYATGEDTVNYPRNLIIADEGSQAVVVEDYHGAGRYLTCPVTQLHLGPGAMLTHHKIQAESTHAWHLGALGSWQAADSHATAHLVSMGGLLNRTDVTALLDGKGAELVLDGLGMVDEGELSDYHLRVEHATSHTTSRQVFKGILNGKSRSVFDSLIHVRPNARKTDASQTNRNLLLSRRALANSNPRLEILADDVKCSHGSTTGFLHQDALFYLRSRGMGEAEARAMLVYAFANDGIEPIRLKTLRERLQRVLLGRLHTPNDILEVALK